jgi:hypothetical protein
MVSQISTMQRSSEYHRRLRPARDATYLNALARRMAAVLGLPLRAARVFCAGK